MQRKHHFAIVDEVDSILIDEARTPLIISGQGDKSTDLYQQADHFAKTLKITKVKEMDAKEEQDTVEGDYIVDEKARTATLTQSGVKKAEQAFEIPHELAGTLSDTREAQGVFCICVKRKEAELETIDPKGTYIALDNMQDPSNLGAVLRTAEAFGMSGVIVGGGCDIYNPKALRAAMGSSMRISVLTTGNLPSLLIFAAKKGMLTLASTPSDGAKRITDMSFSGSVICVVGNEGSGISPEVMSACTLPVTIPMRGRAESLNAAAAAAVLMWELTK